MNDEAQYRYTYSAKNLAEIKEIREKYIPQEDDKMERLRRLDAGATRKGTVASLIIGILGSLIFGAGMSCVLVERLRLLLVGSVIGIVGLMLMIAAYPLFVYVTKKERKRIAPEILQLSNELLRS